MRTAPKIDVSPFLGIVYSPIEIMINSINLYYVVFLPSGSEYTVLSQFN